MHRFRWLTKLAVRPHLPRRTVRLRLTLLFGALFLASGVALLAFTNFLVRRATAGTFNFRGKNGESMSITIGGSGTSSFGVVGSGGKPPPGAVAPSVQHQLQVSGGPGPGLTQQQAQSQAHQLQSLATQQHNALLHQLLVGSWVALGIMTLVSIAFGWLVAGRALRPLRMITTAARDISATNLHERLTLDRPDDELKELGDTFDGLLGRLETSFNAQRRFVANASHELRTPLARQRAVVQVALSDPEATVDTLREAHERVLISGDQQERLIEALLTLTRVQAGLDSRVPVDLATVTDDVITARRSEAHLRGVHLDATLASAPTSGDARLIERLVANLVDNALRHNLADGRIEVVTATSHGHAILTVSNDGPRVPSSEIDRLFEPFQRLGAERTGHHEGLGVGLSIVKAIAEVHGATVTTRPRAQGGLDITLSFSRSTPQVIGLARNGSASAPLPVRPSPEGTAPLGR
ncbi:MAG TPA: ATP-binding protein [Acidimicrobiales bacterium]|nr:ATP-binding protein [Acidimicrobiales bacterium]